MFEPKSWHGENEVRVREMLEFLIKIGLEDLLGPPEPAKSEEFARSLRQRGQEETRKMNFHKAVELFSKAAAHAPAGSKELGLAFYSRSAIMFYADQYEDSYADAGRALELVDDHRIRDEIEERRATCLRAGLRPPSPTELLTIERPNPRIPCASAAIDLKFDAEIGGLGVFAEEDILIAQVLAIEKACVNILNKSFYYTYCYECCLPSFTLIPCESCQYAMFCSEACRTEALRSFHRYECPIMHYLVKMGFKCEDFLALRIVIKTKMELGSSTEVERFIQKAKAEPEDSVAKGFETFRNEAGIDEATYDVSCYELMYAFPFDESTCHINKTIQNSIVVAVLVFLLRKHSSFFEYEVSSKDEQAFYGGLMLHHSMRIVEEVTLRFAFVEDDSENNTVFDICTCGIYPFLNLIKQSTRTHNSIEIPSNVWIKNSRTLVASSSIPKGSQLLRN